MYWPDEDSTTIVRQSAVLKPQASKQACGVSCSVRHGRQVYDGRIAGIGKLLQTQHTLYAHYPYCIPNSGTQSSMKVLDAQFISGEYNPFGSNAQPLEENTCTTPQPKHKRRYRCSGKENRDTDEAGTKSKKPKTQKKKNGEHHIYTSLCFILQSAALLTCCYEYTGIYFLLFR